MAQSTVTAVKNDKSKDPQTPGDIDALSAQIDSIRKDVSALTELLGEIGSRRKSEAEDHLTQRLEELRAKAEETGTRARDQLSDAQHRAQASVREQPGMALAVATTIGFLAGLVLSRK